MALNVKRALYYEAYAMGQKYMQGLQNIWLISK